MTPISYVFLAIAFMFPSNAWPQAQDAATKPALTLGQGSGPIKIEADTLEVRDHDKTATFTGNVVAVRGDTTVRAGTMKAFYDASVAAPAGSGTGAAPGQVRRIEMGGKVLFVQKDQQGTGDSAVYERAGDTLTLLGNVVLTQGKNVARGQKLIVEMKSGHARLEGRPNMILMPNSEAGSRKPETKH